MNNIENTELNFYDKNVFMNQNKKYYEVRDKIISHLKDFSTHIWLNGLDSKSTNASLLMEDVDEAVKYFKATQDTKEYDGRINRILITDRYVYFNYIGPKQSYALFDEVIIDKQKNEFYFGRISGDVFENITAYSIGNNGINRKVYNDANPLFVFDEDSITEAITDLKYGNDVKYNNLAI